MPETAFSTVAKSLELASSTSTLMLETVRCLVSRPDHVTVETHFNRTVVILMLTVAPDDIGIVIGREGRTARSLRVLLSAISNKTNVHFELDIQAERT